MASGLQERLSEVPLWSQKQPPCQRASAPSGFPGRRHGSPVTRSPSSQPPRWMKRFRAQSACCRRRPTTGAALGGFPCRQCRLTAPPAGSRRSGHQPRPARCASITLAPSTPIRSVDMPSSLNPVHGKTVYRYALHLHRQQSHVKCRTAATVWCNGWKNRLPCNGSKNVVFVAAQCLDGAEGSPR